LSVLLPVLRRLLLRLTELLNLPGLLLRLAELALVRRRPSAGATVFGPGLAVPVPLPGRIFRIVVPPMRKAHRHSIPHREVV
jgi:hypothetical protein